MLLCSPSCTLAKLGLSKCLELKMFCVAECGALHMHTEKPWDGNSLFLMQIA